MFFTLRQLNHSPSCVRPLTKAIPYQTITTVTAIATVVNSYGLLWFVLDHIHYQPTDGRKDRRDGLTDGRTISKHYFLVTKNERKMLRFSKKNSSKLLCILLHEFLSKSHYVVERDDILSQRSVVYLDSSFSMIMMSVSVFKFSLCFHLSSY